MYGKHSEDSPLIRRSWVYDILPQLPGWFLNGGHTSAKIRFLYKRKYQYRQELLANCPHCSGERFILLANQERSGLPISVVLCEDCALVFTNPRIDQESTIEHYARDYREIERGSIADLHNFMFGLQRSKGPVLWEMMQGAGIKGGQGGTMVDIGCGEGGLLDWFAHNAGFSECVGFELNKEAAGFGQAKGVDVRNELFEGSGSYDLVVLEQVLEHISSPAKLMVATARSQKPGGWLFVGVPGILNFSSHYGNNFIAYLQYGHLFHYSLYTLERLIIPFGYRLISGDETVRAVFQRVDDVTPAPKTKPLRADDFTRLLLNSEEQFSMQGHQLFDNRRAYVRYALLLARSWLTSFHERKAIAAARNRTIEQ